MCVYNTRVFVATHNSQREQLITTSKLRFVPFRLAVLCTSYTTTITSGATPWAFERCYGIFNFTSSLSLYGSRWCECIVHNLTSKVHSSFFSFAVWHNYEARAMTSRQRYKSVYAPLPKLLLLLCVYGYIPALSTFYDRCDIDSLTPSLKQMRVEDITQLLTAL